MVVWRQRPKIHIWLKTDQITLCCANSTLITSVCAIGKDAVKSGHLPFLSKGAGKSGLLSFLQAGTICGEQAFFFFLLDCIFIANNMVFISKVRSG